MPRFLCLQRPLPGGQTKRPSPAEMQSMYAKFEEWRQRFGEQVSDPGGRLGAGQLVTPQQVTDGPFVEIKELAGGYMIVSSATLEEAIEIARACPGLVQPGSGVEVIEIRAPS